MRITHTVVLILACACAACTATPGYRFPGLKGQVLDSMTRAPVPGAMVNVRPFGGSTAALASVSDASGRFAIQQTATHHYRWPPPSALESWVDAHLEVSAGGYEAQQLPLLDLRKGSLPDTMVYLTRR
jgi:hypothetical protein